MKTLCRESDTASGQQKTLLDVHLRRAHLKYFPEFQIRKLLLGISDRFVIKRDMSDLGEHLLVLFREYQVKKIVQYYSIVKVL